MSINCNFTALRYYSDFLEFFNLWLWLEILVSIKLKVYKEAFF